jgi:hypothetical protein
MKFIAALIVTAACLAGVADANAHKVGLKRIPQEDFSIVFAPCGRLLTVGSYEWSSRAFETKVYGSRS